MFFLLFFYYIFYNIIVYLETTYCSRHILFAFKVLKKNRVEVMCDDLESDSSYINVMLLYELYFFLLIIYVLTHLRYITFLYKQKFKKLSGYHYVFKQAASTVKKTNDSE